MAAATPAAAAASDGNDFISVVVGFGCLVVFAVVVIGRWCPAIKTAQKYERERKKGFRGYVSRRSSITGPTSHVVCMASNNNNNKKRNNNKQLQITWLKLILSGHKHK